MKLYDIAERVAIGFIVITGLSLLLVPIFIVFLTSLTPESFPTIPTDSLTLEWYSEMIANDQLMDALVSSFIVASGAAILAGVVGTVTAFGFVRSNLPHKETLAIFMLLPLMISPVITGLAIGQLSTDWGFIGGYPMIVIGHSVLTLPYVFLIVRSRLITFDNKIESASRILGANRLETAFNITLPVISPTVASAMVIAFVVSFGEFTATQFLISPDVTTVPVVIYTMVRTGLTPEISALSTVLVVVVVIAAAIGSILQRR